MLAPTKKSVLPCSAMAWRIKCRRKGNSTVCQSDSKGSPSSRTSSKGSGASAATAGWLMAFSLAESLSARILSRIAGKGEERRRALRSPPGSQGSTTRLESLPHEGFDLRRGASAARAGDFAATLEDRHGGNPLDPVPGSDRRVDIRVDLDDQDLAGVARRDLADLGGHGPAGAAPGSPEVDQHRYAALAEHPVELTPLIDRHRLGRRRQLGPTGAAARRLPQPGPQHAVLLATGRTGRDEPIPHERYPPSPSPGTTGARRPGIPEGGGIVVASRSLEET